MALLDGLLQQRRTDPRIESMLQKFRRALNLVLGIRTGLFQKCGKRGGRSGS